MDQTRAQQVRVGLVITIALGLLAGALFIIGQHRHLFEGRVRYEIHFSRTNGLLVGAPVSLSGVSVGSVTELAFPPVTLRYITVRVSVVGTVAARVREKTVGRIKTRGLLGDKFIELSAGTPDSPALAPGAIIPSVDPIDYEAWLGESGDIVENVIQATAALRNVFEAIDRGEGLLGEMVKNRDVGKATLGDVRRIVANVEGSSADLQKIIARIERGEGSVGSLLREPGNIQAVITELAGAARELHEFAEQLNKNQALIPRLLRDEAYGNRLTHNLELAVANLAEILGKINAGDGTLGALVNDPQLYRETQQLISGTKSNFLLNLYRGVTGVFSPGDGSSAREQPVSEQPAPRAAPATR